MASIEIKSTSTSGGGGGSGTVTSVGLSSGTTGTDINVSGSPVTTFGTLVLNVPVASAVNTGKLSSTDWLSFNGKQASLVSGVNLGTVNGNTLLGSTDLVISSAPAGTDGQVQYNNGGAFGGDALFNWDDTNKRLGLGTATPLGILHLKTTGGTTRLLIDGNSGEQRLISYRTAGVQRWGLYVNNVGEVGAQAGSNFQIRRYNDAGANIGTPVEINRADGQVTISEKLNLAGSELRNFIPRNETTSINLTINSANQDTFCAAVLEVTGALTITFDGSIRDGFNISVIQKTANSTTFATTGGLTLRNRQGHTKTFGQYSTVTLYNDNANNLILAGDTAP